MQPQQFQPQNKPEVIQPKLQPDPSVQAPPTGVTPPVSPPSNQNTPKPKKRGLLIGLIIAGVVIAAAGVAYFIFFSNGPDSFSDSAPSSDSSKTTSTATSKTRTANQPAAMPDGFTLFERPCYSFGVKELNTTTAQTMPNCDLIGLAYGQNTGDDFSITPLEGSYKSMQECADANQKAVTEDFAVTREIVSKSSIFLDQAPAIEYITDKVNSASDEIYKRVRIIAYNPDKTYDFSLGKRANCIVIDNSHWDSFTVRQTEVLVSTWRWKY